MSDLEESHSDGGGGADGEGGKDLSAQDVTTKYRTASQIADLAMAAVAKGCVVGASLYDLCNRGDNIINEETAKVYNKKEKGKKVEKGVAFPTCLSVNEVCGHFCPLDNQTGGVLKEGDVVKIDMGCHVDGYICVAGHTVVVGDPSAVGERKADVVKAAWTAAEAALRLFRAGGKSSEVTRVIEKAAKEFECTPVVGVMSHQMKRYVIEGSRYVPGIVTAEDKPEEFTFGLNEVYGVDVVISTGEGKARESDSKTTVFRRAVEKKYILKSNLGRHFMSEVENKFPTLPFSLGALEDDRAWKVGVPEALRHELLRPYFVYAEKPGETVAQFKFTVLLLPGGTKKVTGLPFEQRDALKAGHEVQDEELKRLLESTSTPGKKKKKKSPGGAKAADGAAGPADADDNTAAAASADTTTTTTTTQPEVSA